LKATQVDWHTAEHFEPRRIEDKVKAKLRADIDIVIAAITKSGPSTWIRDELADANARDGWIIALVEEGAVFEQGIFGTKEHIRYSRAIEQTFPELLEGINYVKAEKSAQAISGKLRSSDG
jgi:hypothetical protein